MTLHEQIALDEMADRAGTALAPASVVHLAAALALYLPPEWRHALAAAIGNLDTPHSSSRLH